MQRCSVTSITSASNCTTFMTDDVSSGAGQMPDFGALRQAVVKVVRAWVRCVHLAEDVASEAILRAWRTFRFSLPWQRLVGWTVRVARRLVIEWHRVIRRNRVDMDVEVDALPAQDPGTMVDFSDSAAAVRCGLVPGLQGAFRLLVSGASVEEIAADLGITTRGARKLVSRLRGALRASWN